MSWTDLWNGVPIDEEIGPKYLPTFTHYQCIKLLVGSVVGNTREVLMM